MRTKAPFFFVALIFISLLAACSKPPAVDPGAAPPEPKPTGLEKIPMPDPAKMPSVQDLSGWKNPYFVVREDGIGMVDLENHEVHILQPEQIPAELVSLQSSAWPYGRVVLVTQAALRDPTPEAKAELRKNRALLVGTLKDLDVVMREFP